MVAYLGWVGAFAMWGFVSFLTLIPLALIATLISMAVISWFLTTIGGVSLDPLSERGTLPLGETRALDEERFRSDKDGTEKAVRPGRVISEAIVEKGMVVAIASFFFAVDWSGFDKRQPDLFFPKPFRDVWWHFSIILALVFCTLRLLNRKDHSDEG